MSPSRSQRKSVARDTSNSLQTSTVLYRFFELLSTLVTRRGSKRENRPPLRLFIACV